MSHIIGQSIVVGLIAGVVAGVIGAFVLPMFGISNLALPIIVGAVAGAIGPWVTSGAEGTSVPERAR
jgi:uncharacterized membrane protein YeaQ/YmgE (transglycosylase-associated protein family)